MARRTAHPTTFLPMAAGYAPLVGHHRHLLEDEVRTDAFLKAIARVVKPGDVVADLGTGTGVLAIAARRAGARTVWAIDRDPIVHLAEAIARDNGIDGIQFVQQHSKDFTVPEPVDVIVSECFGPLAVGGSMIRAVTELRARCLQPGGRVVPRSVTLFAAPVDDPRTFTHVSTFSRRRYGLDWSAAHALAMHNIYNTVIEPRSLVAHGQALTTIDLERDVWRGDLDASAGFTIRRAGRVHGFAAWFVADLGGVMLSTAPGKPATIWRQVFLPVPPVRAPRGTPVRFGLRCHGGEHFDWAGVIGEHAFACSTRYSHPRSS